MGAQFCSKCRRAQKTRILYSSSSALSTLRDTNSSDNWLPDILSDLDYKTVTSRSRPLLPTTYHQSIQPRQPYLTSPPSSEPGEAILPFFLILTMTYAPVPRDTIINLTFSLLMAILAIGTIWQAAQYAAYRQRPSSSKRPSQPSIERSPSAPTLTGCPGPNLDLEAEAAARSVQLEHAATVDSVEPLSMDPLTIRVSSRFTFTFTFMSTSTFACWCSLPATLTSIQA